MSLFLRVLPGDQINIDGYRFKIEAADIRLVSQDGQVINVSDDPTKLVRGVEVSRTQSEILSGFALSFTAPKDVLITKLTGIHNDS